VSLGSLPAFKALVLHMGRPLEAERQEDQLAANLPSLLSHCDRRIHYDEKSLAIGWNLFDAL